MFIVNFSKKNGRPREATLIIIGMREWLLLGIQTFDEGINNMSAHTH